METHVPTRDEAMALLKEFNQADRLVKHALAVEAVMRYAARKRGEDPEKWGAIGLVHDLDYERWPDDHCKHTGAILRERGWPEEYVRAALSHGWGICTDIEPAHVMEKVLFAADELTGLVTATVYVRPTRSVMDLEAKSVRKKWKDRSFAAGVSREVIEKGAAMLGIDVNDLITETILGMREAAEELGLKGSA